MKRQRGTTLIEQLFALAILGVLCTAAVPSYQDYTVRARVAEVLNLSAQDKVALLEYYATHQEWPSPEVIAELLTSPEASKYLIDDPDYTAEPDVCLIYQLGNLGPGDAHGKILVLELTTNANDQPDWSCKTSTDPELALPAEYLPVSCRGDAGNGDVGQTVM